MKKKDTDRYYVDKKAFYTEMLKWRTERDDALEANREPPRVPDSVGVTLMNIVNKLSTKYNFSKYSFIDEMISDAIENCVAAIPNFDPFKYTNPFAYFSTVAYFAFVRRINNEKKRLLGKYFIAERGMLSMMGEYSQEELDSAFSGILDNQYMKDLVKAAAEPKADASKNGNTWRLRKHQAADKVKNEAKKNET